MGERKLKQSACMKRFQRKAGRITYALMRRKPEPHQGCEVACSNLSFSRLVQSSLSFPDCFYSGMERAPEYKWILPGSLCFERVVTTS